MTDQTIPTTREPTPRLRSLLLLSVALLLSTQACVWQAPTKKGPERAVPPTVDVDLLPMGTAQRGALDCPAGDCAKRYRLEVLDAGRLALELTPVGKPEWIRIVLKNPMQEVVGRNQTEEGGAVVVEQFVRRGPHYVLVQSVGGRTEFEIVARMQHGQAPAPQAAPQGRDLLQRCLDEAPTFCAGVSDEEACVRTNRAGCWERFGGND